MLRIYPLLFVTVVTLTAAGDAIGQQPLDTPQTRLRPIGSSTSNARTSRYPQSQAASLNPIRQVQFEPPPLGGALPSPGGNGVGAPILPSQPQQFQPQPQFQPRPQAPPPQQRTLPPPGSGGLGDSRLMPVPQQPAVVNPGNRVPSSSDLDRIPTPQLNDGFATIDNCNCISAPTAYTATMGYGDCGVAPVTYQTPGYVAPPAQVAAPVVLPGASGPALLPNGLGTPPTAGAPINPLVTFGQQAYQVQVGQGLFGQPVAYVPGQRFRNWIRYIFP